MNNEQTSTSTDTEDVITTGEELFSVLSRIAEATPKRPYPKAVVEFTDKVIEAVVAWGALDELRFPDGVKPTLLSRLLHDLTGMEMQDHNPVLVEFASGVYEIHQYGLKEANRILMDVLQLSSWNEPQYFRKIVEKTSLDGEQECYLVHSELFERKVGRKVRIPTEMKACRRHLGVEIEDDPTLIAGPGQAVDQLAVEEFMAQMVAGDEYRGYGERWEAFLASRRSSAA